MRSAFALALVPAILALHAASASATMYKCAGEANQPTYQDSPCPPGRELRNFDQDPVEIGVMPLNQAPGTTTHAPAGSSGKGNFASPNDRKKDPERKRDVAERRFIRQGMTEAEVTAKIGPPDMTAGTKGRKTTRWSYLPAPGDPQTITTVVLDNGKVIDVERKVVP
jgi:hypothetical protein